jgi:hypothetical protein
MVAEVSPTVPAKIVDRRRNFGFDARRAIVT